MKKKNARSRTAAQLNEELEVLLNSYSADVHFLTFLAGALLQQHILGHADPAKALREVRVQVVGAIVRAGAMPGASQKKNQLMKMRAEAFLDAVEADLPTSDPTRPRQQGH